MPKEDNQKGDSYEKAKDYALKQLEYASKSEKELREKLYSKEYESSVIDRVMDFLKEYNYLDDYKYAKDYIAKKLPTQGKNKMKFSLMSKGISKDIIEELLQDIDSEDEDAIAYEIAEKKYLNLIKSEGDKRKLYKKLGDFLVRKGYSYAVTKKVLERLLQVEL